MHTPNRNLEIPDGRIEHAEDWMGEANDDAERLFNTLPLAHAPFKSGATLVHGVQMMNKVDKLEM